MTALYNEIDDFAADWLENLIAAGQIAPGVVDRRSIEDLEPDYVRCFTQVHFFAGLGLWSLGLRRAGWSDDRPIWTGSCPCQPFSAAGQGAGFADERHLWPAFLHLIRECRPATVAGEQVASKDGLAWLDLISTDLEGEGYAAGAVDICAAGFGAPHIRQRLYWVGRMADAVSDGPQGRVSWGPGASRETLYRPAGRGLATGELAHPHDALRGTDVPARHDAAGPDAGRTENPGHACACGGRGGLADNASGGRGEERADLQGVAVGDRAQGVAAGLVYGGCDCRLADAAHGDGRGGERGAETGTGADGLGGRGFAGGGAGDGGRPGPVNGLWSDADWLFCRDQKWRPVEPGTFPLVDALPRGMGAMGAGLSGLAAMVGADARSLARAKAFRTGTLRGFGNGLNLGQLDAFCDAMVSL